MDTAMINKKVILAVLLLSCGLSVSAQKRGGKSASKPKTEKAAETKETKAGDLNREMEVTRAYEPTVSEANKLNVKPNLVDTVKLRPEFSYGITPSPIAYGFEVTPIKAATVDIDLYKRLNPLYAKVALGYPMQSLADVYFNTTGKSKGMFGAYLNHYGSWSKLENGDGIETPASQTFNKIGVLGERRWTRYVLNGEIGVDYDMVTRYGYANPNPDMPLPASFDTTASGLRQHFTTVRGKVGFGDTFEDLSLFNFRVGVDAAYFNDRFDRAQTGMNAYLDLGKRFGGMHEVTLHTQYEGYFGMDELGGQDNHLVTVAPLYHLKAGKFDFSLGVDFTFNSRNFDRDLRGETEKSKCYFYPRFTLRYDGTNGYFVPFVEIDGRLKSNDYRTLASMNPYVGSAWAPNTSEYNGRVGITGSFSSAFSYKVYGGLTHAQDMATFANLFVPERQSYGNLFDVLNDTVTMWTVGADLEGRISGAFGIEASVQYKGFSKKRFDHVSGVPNFTGRLDLRYSIRDKMILTAGATLQSSRWFALSGREIMMSLPELIWQQVGTTVDVHFGAEYRISKAVGVFLQGNNLANQKLYPYYFYRGLGINVLAGVKLVF
ncbi:hypothetical protein HMPREF9450_01338 [Alistipes indistinctus YIT 12060]|jgi:hypothetical protein|uniref:TonB-dependent receptor-like beta-barrel domain-containing protein n=3 Tax=Alistipes indistinctus TaxID=626932 RepID=G5H9M3_9BACT|nr:hypothetical protein HMPREF9450_01338 [Alistipes indistinctus YIT 12060]